MSAIEAKNLIVVKGKKTILDSLNFAVQPGTITGLIGPSGSGKTTLMRTIVGVQKYTGGLNVLDDQAGDKSLRWRIGYVTQSPAIYDDLTVAQNLHYFGKIARASKEDVTKIIEAVDLKNQSSQLVGSLSGGQRARVSLAIALLGNPDLLVLDEPTVGLDPVLRNKLWKLFEGLAASGKTLLVSSHVMDEAERCSQLLLIRDGRILWNDSRDKLLKVTKTNNVGDAFVAEIEETK